MLKTIERGRDKKNHFWLFKRFHLTLSLNSVLNKDYSYSGVHLGGKGDTPPALTSRDKNQNQNPRGALEDRHTVLSILAFFIKFPKAY